MVTVSPAFVEPGKHFVVEVFVTNLSEAELSEIALTSSVSDARKSVRNLDAGATARVRRLRFKAPTELGVFCIDIVATEAVSGLSRSLPVCPEVVA